MHWAPIADRPQGARARRAIRELAAILAEPAADASPSLALGDAGTAVFFAYLGRARFPGIGRRAADRARFYARRAVAGQAQDRLLLGLFGGLAGVGWMLHHLRGAELPRRDLCAELDAGLCVAIEHGALDGEVDLVTGLCGVGIYALARRNRQLAAAVVSRLLARDPWGDPAREAVDLGTAHGLAGLVAMLGQARAARIPGAARLAQWATRALLDQARWNLPSVFPDASAPGAPPRDCRLAWCYGDIGAACALLSVAEATRSAGLCTTALRVARRAAARPFAGSGVLDCGICHGAAGVAFGLQRLFVAGGDPVIADAARSWLGRALDHGIPTGLLDGSDTAAGRGLLGGAGLGLAYLAAITATPPRWASALTMMTVSAAGARPRSLSGTRTRSAGRTSSPRR